MTECVSFIQKNGEFTIEFENGKIKRNSKEQSYALHNLLCFGRLAQTLTVNQKKKLGWAGSILYGREFFSTAWNYYLESNSTQNNFQGIINEFNSACLRDYSSGLLDKRILIYQILRLSKNDIKIFLTIDGVKTSTQVRI